MPGSDDSGRSVLEALLPILRGARDGAIAAHPPHAPVVSFAASHALIQPLQGFWLLTEAGAMVLRMLESPDEG